MNMIMMFIVECGDANVNDNQNGIIKTCKNI